MNDHQFSFHGEGSKLFGIVIVNLLLTVITLGFYYPWAKAALTQYIYKETELDGSRFTFHGTGKEMFKGFIKAVIIIILIYGQLFLFQYLNIPLVGLIIFYLLFLALIPFVIHGSMRYRMSRTSWRGIHFGYRGKFNELSKVFYRDVFFTIITFGIYGAWMAMNLRKYTVSNVRYGDVEFDYHGKGGQYFWINFKGYLLTIFTLGIYSAWWMKDLVNYYYTNITLKQSDQKLVLKSTISGSELFGVVIINVLIVVFTFGIAAPWAQVRMLKFLCKNLFVDGQFNPNDVTQTEEEYKDATGDDLGDMLDIGII